MIANRARFHRFHELIAFDISGMDSAGNPTGTETVYISADLAERIAALLIEYAADIRHAGYGVSPMRTKIETETGE